MPHAAEQPGDIRHDRGIGRQLEFDLLRVPAAQIKPAVVEQPLEVRDRFLQVAVPLLLAFFLKPRRT
jgi:hypothetical protein